MSPAQAIVPRLEDVCELDLEVRAIVHEGIGFYIAFGAGRPADFPKVMACFANVLSPRYGTLAELAQMHSEGARLSVRAGVRKTTTHYGMVADSVQDVDSDALAARVQRWLIERLHSEGGYVIKGSLLTNGRRTHKIEFFTWGRQDDEHYIAHLREIEKLN